MNAAHHSTLDRLMALSTEAEQALARGLGSHDIRHTCAVARGYLELAAEHGEPIRIEDVERILHRLRTSLAAVLTPRSSAHPSPKVTAAHR